MRLPDGSDDLLLVESGRLDMDVALALLGRLARKADDAPLDIATLPISDVDALVLRLRQRTVGDVVSGEELCRAPGCHTRVDITFSIESYLDHHRPAMPSGVVRSADDGWFTLSDAAVEFRLPCAADYVAIAGASMPEDVLLQRCVRPAGITEEVRRRVEQAMEAMSPSLHSELEGRCPACGATVEATFDPVQYALRELYDQAAFIYEEVCAIAHFYHWSEADILALPAARRARYAELGAQQAQRGGALV